MTNEEAVALGLTALGWTVSDSMRATRLLDLTGLTPADLRARAAEPAVLVAMLGFLEAHESDLIACAAALDDRPARLVAARMTLEHA